MTGPVTKKRILAREALGSTAVGKGIAIPHAKVAAVKEPTGGRKCLTVWIMKHLTVLWRT